MSTKALHGPAPWTVLKDGKTIWDATCSEVTKCNYTGDAAFITKAVNDHAKLHEIACGLTKSRDIALKDADRLRALVRRFMGIVNNYPPIMSAWALLDAEEPEWRKLSKEQQAAMVPEGYKRLSALMRDAYAAVGPEEVGE